MYEMKLLSNVPVFALLSLVKCRLYPAPYLTCAVYWFTGHVCTHVLSVTLRPSVICSTLVLEKRRFVQLCTVSPVCSCNDNKISLDLTWVT